MSDGFCNLEFVFDGESGQGALTRVNMTRDAYVALIERVTDRLLKAHYPRACSCENCERAQKLVDVLQAWRAPTVGGMQ